MSQGNILSIVFLSVLLILILFFIVIAEDNNENAIAVDLVTRMDEGPGPQATVIVVIDEDGRYFIDTNTDIPPERLVSSAQRECGVVLSKCQIVLDARPESSVGSLTYAIGLFRDHGVNPSIAAKGQ